ncbi:MAG: ABC transporter permease [Deltaproteobacteria bacterium]|nr:ABC transporter permease [Deltaproteobacteria bacterium]MBW1928129.1 ABC transporter permease [Deltaproteobacteria bacterium]MBW2025676.1 ABC transporter permease [Deltaproteobacteria bacterium]MBW2127306.1 ABC transporter permease [Deltaproteobacteria bacterium]RLB18138.1 MAG: ABC transporter permease [Deltaproteobacteria bacterium]
MNWIRVKELVRKEFIQLFRDKRTRPLIVISPLIQLIIFGYVVTTDVRDIRVALLDQCRTPESRQIIDAFNGNRTFRITRFCEYPGEMEELLLRRKVDMAVKIPPDFSATLRKGKTASIQILVDGSASNMAAVRIAYTMNVLQQFNKRFIHELYARTMEYGSVNARIRTWYNPNLDSRNFYVPGIVAFLIMLLTLLFTSMAIIREKESGTMEQLIVTPLKPSELIMGKTIPYIILVESQMVLVTVFAILWFDVPMKGSVPLLFLATCLFLLSTLGIGLFISTVSSTKQQAVMTTFFFAMPFFMLSGFVFPIANMPTVVQWFTYLNPLRYLLVIIRGIFLKGIGMEILWPQFLAMTILGIVVFSGAVNRFKKRLD